MTYQRDIVRGDLWASRPFRTFPATDKTSETQRVVLRADGSLAVVIDEKNGTRATSITLSRTDISELIHALTVVQELSITVVREGNPR